MRNKSRRGISLLEVLVGFTILASAFLALLQIFPAAHLAIDRGKDQLVAAQLAQAYLDDARSRAYDSMTDTSATVEVPFVVNGGSSKQTYDILVQVLPQPSGTALNQSASANLQVQVQWRSAGQGAAASQSLGTVRVVRLESVRARDI